MSFATSTDAPASGATWFFVAVSALGAIAAGVMTSSGSPAGTVMTILAVLGAGLSAYAFYRTLLPFTGTRPPRTPVGPRARQHLEREKALVLRSIKELEFDRAMGKVADSDFQEMAQRLRARAVALMKRLERPDPRYRAEVEQELRRRLAALDAPRRHTPASPPMTMPSAGTLEASARPIAGARMVLLCDACQTINDADAHFCKRCGQRFAQ